MDDRNQEILEFFRSNGLSGAVRKQLAGDASTRRYERLELPNDRRLILMDSLASLKGKICPPDAGEAERRRLGYDALARRSTGKVEAFVCLSDWLIRCELSAPRIVACAPELGLALLEDLGDNLYCKFIDEGHPIAEQYSAAVDVIVHLSHHVPPRRLSAMGCDWEVLDYDLTALLVEVDLLLDWYVGRQLGRSISAKSRHDWRGAWSTCLEETAHDKIVLRDFHSPNLIWLPSRSALQRVGLLDFQDALIGSSVFDLMSLLEDPRRVIPTAIVEACKKQYVERLQLDDADFDAEFAALGAQRNAKLIGIFARLALAENKPQYLQYTDRVISLFRAHLQHPMMRKVREWTRSEIPELGA
ncbi:MAG: phosphotransferase [Sulfuritalea sp.]|nr:phosphotransferase [Sulfuritalea sp.]